METAALWAAVLKLPDLMSALTGQLRHQAALARILTARSVLRRSSRRLARCPFRRRFPAGGTIRLFFLRLDRQFVGHGLELQSGLAGLLGLDRDADRTALLELTEQNLVG